MKGPCSQGPLCCAGTLGYQHIEIDIFWKWHSKAKIFFFNCLAWCGFLYISGLQKQLCLFNQCVATAVAIHICCAMPLILELPLPLIWTGSVNHWKCIKRAVGPQSIILCFSRALWKSSRPSLTELVRPGWTPNDNSCLSKDFSSDYELVKGFQRKKWKSRRWQNTSHHTNSGQGHRGCHLSPHQWLHLVTSLASAPVRHLSMQNTARTFLTQTLPMKCAIDSFKFSSISLLQLGLLFHIWPLSPCPLFSGIKFLCSNFLHVFEGYASPDEAIKNQMLNLANHMTLFLLTSFRSIPSCPLL